MFLMILWKPYVWEKSSSLVMDQNALNQSEGKIL